MNRLEPIRVLRIIGRMNVGGPAWQVTALNTRLNDHGVESRLITGSVAPGELDYLEMHGIDCDVVRLPTRGRALSLTRDARAVRAIRREIQNFRPHIVHTHTAKAGVLGRTAVLASSGLRTVHTFHGHLLSGYFRPSTVAALRSLERRLARRTDRLIAVGERVRDELLEAGIGRPDQYLVIPPGVEDRGTLGQTEARRALGIPLQVPTVAFAGRLTAVKRPDRLIEVARYVTRAVPAHFIIAGDGDLAESARLEAQDLADVTFLGWRRDMAEVYAAADVVLLTSDNEGMPVSLIEAAMAGRAAVTTDVGSAGEVVASGRTGFVTSTDPSAMAAAVIHLLTHETLRRAMGESARLRARARFSVDRLVRDHADLYRSLAQPRGA